MQSFDIKYELKKCFVDRDDLSYTLPGASRPDGTNGPARRVEIVKCVCGQTLAEPLKKKHLLTRKHRNFILSTSRPIDTLRYNMMITDMRANVARVRITGYVQDLSDNEIINFNDLVTRHMEEMRDLVDSEEESENDDQ